MTASETDAKPKLPELHHTLLGVAAHLVPPPPGMVMRAIKAAPRGDGHPVIVVPSFLRGDGNTAPLRRFLKGCGYAVEGWGLGTNIGPTAAALDGVGALLMNVHRRHGRKVTLIGHSLGGVIARELAKQHPEQVRQLLVMASPIHLPTASPLEPVYKLLARWHSIDPDGSMDQLNTPPVVPVTAIYTKSDGVVAWQSCREIEGACRESIEIRGPHGTMVRNPTAWQIVADRLAQPEGEWRAYGDKGFTTEARRTQRRTFTMRR
jgi:pimeloyl-ACP methyl ester carboxylesterase